MELPAALRAAIETELERIPLADLKQAAGALSKRYRAETRDGRYHLDAKLAIKAYLAARMPATYAAVRASFEMVARAVPMFAPASLLDVGAGPGTALWAAKDCWPSLLKAQMVEASAPARDAGEALGRHLDGVSATWRLAGALSLDPAPLSAELVTAAYVLDELEPTDIGPLIDRLWSQTSSTLVIVEPGTPAGWRRIVSVRQRLIATGAHIIAPCPHDAPCPLAAPDWCHFAQRLPRSRLHRLTKDGDAPFEDEKYIFVAASRIRAVDRKARVLAPPRAGKAWVDLKLCQPDGVCDQIQVTKRQGEIYRMAKKLDWGDGAPAELTS